jgi:hypothetical protein
MYRPAYYVHRKVTIPILNSGSPKGFADGRLVCRRQRVTGNPRRTKRGFHVPRTVRTGLPLALFRGVWTEPMNDSGGL